MSQLKARNVARTPVTPDARQTKDDVKLSPTGGEKQKSKVSTVVGSMVLCLAFLSLHYSIMAIGKSNKESGRFLQTDDALVFHGSRPLSEQHGDSLGLDNADQRYTESANTSTEGRRPRIRSSARLELNPRSVRGRATTSDDQRRLRNMGRNIFRYGRKGGGGGGGGGMGGGGGALNDVLDDVDVEDVEEVIDAAFQIGNAIYKNVLKYAPICFPPPAPTTSPSASPSGVPSVSPSIIPSNHPSLSAQPSAVPSVVPTMLPTSSIAPSSIPSGMPSKIPSSVPSGMPSSMPSGMPSSMPSSIPSGVPSASVAPSMRVAVPLVAGIPLSSIGNAPLSNLGVGTHAPSASQQDEEDEESSFDFHSGED